MKRCGKCAVLKPLDEYHASTRDGRQLWCKDCRRTYDREYHFRNRARRLQQVKERRRHLAEWHNRLKSTTPCADCGGIFHPAAVTWDPLPGSQKVADVSALIQGGRTIQARAEMEKCELVCANCHAVRSYERQRGVAQPGRASRLGREGRQFESARPD